MKQHKLLLCMMVIILTGITSSCSKWLDVKPKTAIESEDLFTTESGFVDALTGIYKKLGVRGLYGRELTYGFMDILAQRYDRRELVTSVWYNYLNNDDPNYSQSVTVNFYNSLYNIIANLNNIIEQVDKRSSVFTTANYHDVIKGEALGLRAFLHFELLRMFGPIYSESPNAKSIPYRLAFGVEATPVLPANEVIANVIKDFLAAQDCLKNSDPQDFTKTSANPFLYLRQLRMNIYAVKALLARTYLYRNASGDKALAVQYATEVINSNRFVLSESNNPDKILSSEHIFGLNINGLKEIVAADFGQTLYIYMLYAEQTTIQDVFETTTGGSSDFRGADNGFSTVNGKKNLLKFNGNYVLGSAQYEVMPLVRLPEMYYILAECVDSPSESAAYINTVRNSRAIASSYDMVGDATWDAAESNGHTKRINMLMKEYQKEYYGEGQLFYFYKRNNYKTFFHCPISTGMTSTEYVFPLPDNEIIYGK